MNSPIFAGLKVLDFTWAAAGPIITKQLADNGATVVKVESSKHPDSIRLGGPFAGGTPGINKSGFFADFNSSKLGLALDMSHPRAGEVIEPLIAWADVLAESFRPGMMARWGFDYEWASRINPRLIMLSSSLYGPDGPWAEHPGFGAQGAALAGFHAMTGWPDRPPAAPKGAYTDSVSPRFGTAALLAALIHRERTGKGQYITLSQIETGIMLLSPELLQMQLSGSEPMRRGNRDERALVHGVYPCLGTENWIAIEVRDENTLQRFVSVLWPLGDTPACLISATDADAIDAVVGAATAHWDSFDLMQALRETDVPAGVAFRGNDLLEDPVLRARSHYWPLEHTEMGTLDYNGPAYRFSVSPTELRHASPTLGQHTEEILSDILQLPAAAIADLRAAALFR
ncbi:MULTISPECIES: CoA transferase [unclassified Beijerinckia]|uniref:CaiB/BaiF CoA transferase family protein n=1 Tax=unclassified Beijerinckia TaxID=2638183 RepID=UPI00089CCA8D|nr:MULTISPECIES: CoA transferase [unclassified Beijerinckia]MDH7793943.1 benzylsuccinate CoA-transferase BbsF subunit [Beijerinckia sp. GAS462]SEB49925.1 benzylsuccinate CoA-transferase BbsF subunit [Beijerinckia sp. 28-YEA-48]